MPKNSIDLAAILQLIENRNMPELYALIHQSGFSLNSARDAEKNTFLHLVVMGGKSEDCSIRLIIFFLYMCLRATSLKVTLAKNNDGETAKQLFDKKVAGYLNQGREEKDSFDATCLSIKRGYITLQPGDLTFHGSFINKSNRVLVDLSAGSVAICVEFANYYKTHHSLTIVAHLSPEDFAKEEDDEHQFGAAPGALINDKFAEVMQIISDHRKKLKAPDADVRITAVTSDCNSNPDINALLPQLNAMVHTYAGAELNPDALTTTIIFKSPKAGSVDMPDIYAKRNGERITLTQITADPTSAVEAGLFSDSGGAKDSPPPTESTDSPQATTLQPGDKVRIDSCKNHPKLNNQSATVVHVNPGKGLVTVLVDRTRKEVTIKYDNCKPRPGVETEKSAKPAGSSTMSIR